MKKLIFSTAAIVMALSFNAFAGTPEKAEVKPTETSAKAENVECYRETNGTFRVKVGNGTCESAPTLHCSYIYIGDEEAGEDQNEENYTPMGDLGYRWQPQ